MRILHPIPGRIFLPLLVVCAFTVPLRAQEMPVPVDVQFSLFAKIISFDRQFAARSPEQVGIGIVYQRTHRPSVRAKDDAVQVFQASPGVTVNGKPIWFVELDITDGVGTLTAEALQGIDLLYIAPLRAVDVGSIASLARTNHIRSITGVPEYVEGGIAVGIGTRGERPEILINLSASKAEGADFSSQLLKLAKVIP